MKRRRQREKRAKNMAERITTLKKNIDYIIDVRGKGGGSEARRVRGSEARKRK